MKGHGQKLTRKQEVLIGALLDEPSYADAARKAGISETTLYRWLRRPDFQAAYRASRRQIVEGAIARLQQTTGMAVDALKRNLTAGQPGAEIRAALGILDHASKGVELLDHEDRLAELERRLDQSSRPSAKSSLSARDSA